MLIYCLIDNFLLALLRHFKLKKRLFAYLSLLLIAPYITLSAEDTSSSLKPFTTDGCSSFPDGTLSQQSLWVNCCIRHDLAYWKGGTETERYNADKELESCVANVGKPEIAKIMLAGVRVGGSPIFNTPFRWGYGWPYRGKYAALTKADKLEIKQKLDMLKLMINSLSNQLDITKID